MINLPGKLVGLCWETVPNEVNENVLISTIRMCFRTYFPVFQLDVHPRTTKSLRVI